MKRYKLEQIFYGNFEETTKKMKCQCCKKEYEKLLQDYRGYSGNITKYLVCEECFFLPDNEFRDLKNKTIWRLFND